MTLSASVSGNEEVSEYEAQRLMRIEANKAKLLALGICPRATRRRRGPLPQSSSPSANSISTSTTLPRKKRSAAASSVAVPSEGLRRSKRARGAKPDYTGASIDALGLDEEVREKYKREQARQADDARNLRRAKTVAADALAIERCRAALEAGRAAMAARPTIKLEPGICRDDTSAAGIGLADFGVKREEIDSELAGTTDEANQKALAEAMRRWGRGVLMARSAAPSSGEGIDWCTYLSSRNATPPPGIPSPYALMQERYSHDVWQLLCACVLMSRVSSAPVKERCVGAFFTACPTPTALLNADPETLRPHLASLGLFANRISAVVALTKRFLLAPCFELGLQPPLKVPGLGAFAVDSYRLFCKGWEGEPTDKNLRAFARWLRESKRDTKI